MQTRTRLTLIVLLATTLACSSVGIFSQPPTATPIPPTPTELPTATPMPTPTSTPNPTATPTPPAAASEEDTVYIITEREDGWQTYENFEYGFSLDLPPNWVVLDMTSDNLSELFEFAIETNPDFGEFFTPEMLTSLMNSGVKLYALDGGIDGFATGMASNLNFLLSELPISLSLDDYIELNIAQLTSMFGEDLQLEEERMTIDGIDAAKFSYVIALNNPDGESVQVHYEQYLFLIGKMQYVLTCVSADATYTQNSILFGQIIDSLKIDQ